MSEQENKPKPRILLADDSRVIRTSGSKILGAEFDLVLAVDGQEAWEQVQKDRDISVLFTDIGMPFLDGMELLDKIRHSDDEGIAQLPVVILTGDESDEAREDALRRGASDFITKPFNKVDLLARARSHATAQVEKRELEAQSTVDRLTGLASERHFDAKLEEMRAFTLRHEHTLSLMEIRIDNLKQTVQAVGKETFLRRLRDIASLIKVCVRKEDTAARVAAVKFGIVLPMCDSTGATTLAKRIQATLQAGAKRAGWSKPISLSIGISTPSLDGKLDLDGVLKDLQAAATAAEKAGPGAIMLSPMTQKRLKAAGAGASMSVDAALKVLANGDEKPVIAQLDKLLERLGPLLRLAGRDAKYTLRKYIE